MLSQEEGKTFFSISPSKTNQQQITAGIAFSTMLLSTLLSYASPPQWWAEREVIKAGAEEENYQTANIGQVKWIATQAYAELAEQNLPLNPQSISTPKCKAMMTTATSG